MTVLTDLSNQAQISNSKVKTLELTAEGVLLLDQTILPREVRYAQISTASEMAHAIETMIVRGAPAIGIAGAYGAVLSARQHQAKIADLNTLKTAIQQDMDHLKNTRPTAVNLAWALDRMAACLNHLTDVKMVAAELEQEALAIFQEDLEANLTMGQLGADLVPQGARILTHCNAGALATSGHGTALGVIRSAFAQDPTIQVYADETRPRLQGARLTTWELIQDGIPVTLITDGMSGSLMQQGLVDLVVVGADRIAANGDTANKIGTYNLALVAHAHNVPFYVAAPSSTIDLATASGKEIPIEQRPEDEIYWINDEAICPQETRFYNPSFDVTPARYIHGIITEKGIAKPNYTESLAHLFG